MTGETTHSTAPPAEKRDFPGLDAFRLVAAFLVVAIHTSPLWSVNQSADFLLTRVVARLAVPFFFMASGFFLARSAGPRPLARFLAKNARLYGLCILLYLPLNWYLGDFGHPNLLARSLRDLLWNGTVYHLWYFPALLLGGCIAWLLWRRLPRWAGLAVCGALYLLGLGGDSWHGLLAALPAANGFYGFLFTLFSYTRNGLFFAPLFIYLGLLAARRPQSLYGPWPAAAGFALSFAAMVAEALTLRAFGAMRHDSMYLMLPFCSLWLFALLLRPVGAGRPGLRRVSALVYILHPWCIVAVRGAAKAIGAQGLLVEVSPVFYLCVCLLSLGLALLAARLPRPPAPGRHHRKTARAWVETDAGALSHNLDQLSSLLAPGAAVMAVVKGNAYGHGAVWAARSLWRAGVRAFAVATLEEGAALRRHGIGGTILVLGYTPPEEAFRLWLYRLTQTAVDAPHALALSQSGWPLRVHLKVDTGMHRLGFGVDDIEGIAAAYALPRLRVQGIYTHLARADSLAPADADFTQGQIDGWYALLAALRRRGVHPGATHLQSSYGLLNHPGLPCHYARLGLALYGVLEQPAQHTRSPVRLRPALCLKARLGSVRALDAGDYVGYGGGSRCNKKTLAATLTVGYGDGLPRNLSSNTSFLLHGKRVPVLGRLCMDQLTLDVSGVPHAAPGDIVTLIGRDGTEACTAEALAAEAGTITNELLAGLSPRLGRLAAPPPEKAERRALHRRLSLPFRPQRRTGPPCPARCARQSPSPHC